MNLWTSILVAALALAATESVGPLGADETFELEPGQVGIEYVAHACFRLHAPDGTRILIDPFASRVWLGYDWPGGIEADVVLITHPHYDHDGGQSVGHAPPWGPDTLVLREPGDHSLGELGIVGVRGKHADPYGKEFGQRNTIWCVELEGLRVVHVGDNGPLTPEVVRALGRVDVLMLPIDGNEHILDDEEVAAIRAQLRPRVVVPMHYRHPDLEPGDGPDDLGPIDPWLERQRNVVRLREHRAVLRADALLPAEQVVVFPHSPRVKRH